MGLPQNVRDVSFHFAAAFSKRNSGEKYMKTKKFELLPPGELLKEIRGTSTVFVPIGSMEWHGPHMGMGMDTCNAYHVSLATAERTGGIVFPPLFIGTETRRSPETLKKLGFTGAEDIVGMDFPANSLKSMYWPPQLFEQLIGWQIEALCRMGFRKIIIMNGHGADEQIRILDTLSREFSEKYQISVRAIMVLADNCGYGLGHAGLAETAIMTRIYPEAVDLSKLPPKTEKISMVEYGIADSMTFEQGPTEDFSVRYDPRDATSEIGEELLEAAVEKCVKIVEQS